MSLPENKFDKNYYENGITTGTSGYQDYKWMPTRSISEAITITKEFKFGSALDFGCAKGFLVHALQLLGHKKVSGVDISTYALENCIPAVKEDLRLIKDRLYDMRIDVDLLIAKDVMEHIPEEKIHDTLRDFYMVCKQALLVIPLGDNNMFRIREYEVDKTHVTRKDEEWWINKIKKAGFKLKRFDYSMGHIKEKWIEPYPFGNGFFVIEK